MASTKKELINKYKLENVYIVIYLQNILLLDHLYRRK